MLETDDRNTRTFNAKIDSDKKQVPIIQLINHEALATFVHDLLVPAKHMWAKSMGRRNHRVGGVLW